MKIRNEKQMGALVFQDDRLIFIEKDYVLNLNTSNGVQKFEYSFFI